MIRLVFWLILLLASSAGFALVHTSGSDIVKAFACGGIYIALWGAIAEVASRA